MILCYHAVEDGWSSPLAVPTPDFTAQCAWFARARRVVDLDDALAVVDRRGRLPRGAVALTFDDGFEDLHRNALPVLRALRLPATVFIVAQTLTETGKQVDWVDTPPTWTLRTLSLDQILEMQDAGIRFGSHTWSHPRLPMLDDAQLARELRDSRELLEDLLGRSVPHLAYPRGLHSARVRRAAEAAGYSSARGLPVGPEPAGRFAVPRVGIYHENGLTTVRIKASRWYLPLRTSRAYATVQSLRRRS